MQLWSKSEFETDLYYYNINTKKSLLDHPPVAFIQSIIET